MPVAAGARPSSGCVHEGGVAKVLCLTCRRVRPALNPAEYTADRALLITRHGLCCCAHTARPVPPRAPAAPAAPTAPAAAAR